MGIQLGLILLLVVAALLIAKKFQKKDISDADIEYVYEDEMEADELNSLDKEID